MPARNASGVKMPNPLDVCANRRDQIAFHDLHVVDVIQQLHIRRVHLLHHVHSPGRVVAHVIVMVALAVEQLQADRHAMIFRDLLHAIQPGNRVARAFVVGHARAVT